MSATMRPRVCPAHSRAVRYRNEHQARGARDRARSRQLAAGMPPALCLAQWFRCPACRGWHLRVDAAAVRAFLQDLSVSGARVRRLLDAAA